MMFTMMTIIAAVCLALFASAPSLPSLKDAALKLTRALPASITAVTTTTSIDMGPRTADAFLKGWEFLLTAPALSTAELPDSKTMSYSIVHASNAALSGATTLLPNLIVQTGAGGAGAAGATFRFRVPTTALQYVGFTITPSASGTGDASAETATMEAVF